MRRGGGGPLRPSRGQNRHKKYKPKKTTAMINETIEPHYTIISNKNFTFFKTLDLVRNTSPAELNELIKMIQILKKLDPNNVTDKQTSRKFLINSINNN